MKSPCPRCGYEPQLGRPKGLDDRHVAKLRIMGQSIRQIARTLLVSHGAVQGSLARTSKKLIERKKS